MRSGPFRNGTSRRDAWSHPGILHPAGSSRAGGLVLDEVRVGRGTARMQDGSFGVRLRSLRRLRDEKLPCDGRSGRRPAGAGSASSGHDRCRIGRSSGARTRSAAHPGSVAGRRRAVRSCRRCTGSEILPGRERPGAMQPGIVLLSLRSVRRLRQGSLRGTAREAPRSRAPVPER